MLDAGLRLPLKAEFEFLVKEVHFRAKVFQKKTEPPHFLLRADPALRGFEKAAAESALALIRKILLAYPSGDFAEPDLFPYLDRLKSAFPLLPVPQASLVLRLPVLNTKSVSFINKLGDSFGIGAALFRSPEGHGFLIASEIGFMEILNRLDQHLNLAFRTSG